MDEARLRLNRTEFDLNGFQAPAYVSVDGGILATGNMSCPMGGRIMSFISLIHPRVNCLSVEMDQDHLLEVGGFS